MSLYKRAGVDLDTILAAYVPGHTQAPLTKYKQAGADLNTFYDSIAYGSAPPVTNYESANNDFNTIFAAASSVTPLTLFLTDVATSTLSTANGLSQSEPSSEAGFSSAYRNSAIIYQAGEMYSQGGTNISTHTDGSLIVPSGHGWLFDTTALEGHTIPEGLWTFNLKYYNPNSAPYTVRLTTAMWIYNGGVYSYLQGGIVTHSSYLSGTNAVSLSANTTGQGPYTMSTGDKLYLYVEAGGEYLAYLPQTITIYENGGVDAEIVTPGYT